MKVRRIILLIAIAAIFTACHKDDDEKNGELLGAWRVENSIAYEYDSEGNLLNTWNEDEFCFRYVDYNEEGNPEYFTFSVSNGDNWEFVNDTMALINDKAFSYEYIIDESIPSIIIEFPYIEYKIETLSKSKLKLIYLEFGSITNTKKQEITFKRTK